MDEYNVRAVPWRGGWELHIDGVGVTQVDERDEQLAFNQVKDYIEADRGEPLTMPGTTINITWGRPPLPINEFYAMFVGDRCFRCPEKGIVPVIVSDIELLRGTTDPAFMEFLCRDCLRGWMRDNREKPRLLTLVNADGTTYTKMSRLNDGRVMCCLCFGYKTREELNPLPDGTVEDVCRTCAEKEKFV